MAKTNVKTSTATKAKVIMKPTKSGVGKGGSDLQKNVK